MCLAKLARRLPSSAKASSWLARTFTTANSHATKNPLSATRPAITSNFPRTMTGEPHWSVTATVIASERGKVEKKKLIDRMQPGTRTRSQTFYQLDLVTPGMSPLDANSRKVRREILNRRIKARRRPDTWQRLTTRVGLASRGSCERPA